MREFSLATLGVSITLTCMIINAQGYEYNSQIKTPHKPSDTQDGDVSFEAATPVQYRLRSQQSSQPYEYSDEEGESTPIQQTFQRQLARPTYQVQSQPSLKKIASKKQQLADELADEIEEPDRLALLLEKSNFQCHDRVTGYYADDSVGCEVFHYCQDSSKHSWVCPEGFTFHQVHLICMPPSSENICENSQKYHIVNEYLYKPINMDEHQKKNVALKYSDRYFPGEIYYDDRRDYPDEHQTIRTSTSTVTARKQSVQRPGSSTTAPFKQQNYNQNAYRSPEDINISLQQRRPTLPPQKYDEEEYDSYEN